MAQGMFGLIDKNPNSYTRVKRWYKANVRTLADLKKKIQQRSDANMTSTQWIPKGTYEVLWRTKTYEYKTK